MKLLKIAAGLVLLPHASSVTLLGCIYGASQCLGLPEGDGKEKARELGCPVAKDGDREYFAPPQTTIDNLLSYFQLAGSKSVEYGDGMPCTFSPDDDREELLNLKLADIVITMADGTTRSPSGGSYMPAIERNEQITLLLIGDFGWRDNLTMSSVSIKGSTYSGPGLSFANQGNDMAMARWFDVQTHADLEGSGTWSAWIIDLARGRNDCRARFGDTTHVVQIVTYGGMTVTFNGHEGLPFDVDAEKHKQMFKVLFGSDRSELPADRFLGLADAEDGDNFLDLCLKLTDEDVQKIADDAGGLTVRLLSTRDCQYWVLPKGDCLSDLVGQDCGDCSTRSQEICVSSIPDAKFSCDPKAAASNLKYVTLSEAEVSGLTECEFITPEFTSPLVRTLFIWVGIALVVCAVAGGGTCYLWRKESPSPRPDAVELTAE